MPADAVVLSADEAADLSDRVYQVRCAAEDVATAVDEGAGTVELRELCDELIHAARVADGWRRAGVLRRRRHRTRAGSDVAETFPDMRLTTAMASRVQSRHGLRACLGDIAVHRHTGKPASHLLGRGAAQLSIPVFP